MIELCVESQVHFEIKIKPKQSIAFYDKKVILYIILDINSLIMSKTTYEFLENDAGMINQRLHRR